MILRIILILRFEMYAIQLQVSPYLFLGSRRQIPHLLIQVPQRPFVLPRRHLGQRLIAPRSLLLEPQYGQPHFEHPPLLFGKVQPSRLPLINCAIIGLLIHQMILTVRLHLLLLVRLLEMLFLQFPNHL